MTSCDLYSRCHLQPITVCLHCCWYAAIPFSLHSRFYAGVTSKPCPSTIASVPCAFKCFVSVFLHIKSIHVLNHSCRPIQKYLPLQGTIMLRYVRHVSTHVYSFLRQARVGPIKRINQAEPSGYNTPPRRAA